MAVCERNEFFVHARCFLFEFDFELTRTNPAFSKKGLMCPICVSVSIQGIEQLSQLFRMNVAAIPAPRYVG